MCPFLLDHLTIPKGKHIVSVNMYSNREKKDKVPFTIFIENGDESRIYNSYVQEVGIKTREVVEFELIGGELFFKDLIL